MRRANREKRTDTYVSGSTTYNKPTGLRFYNKKKFKKKEWTCLYLNQLQMRKYINIRFKLWVSSRLSLNRR